MNDTANPYNTPKTEFEVGEDVYDPKVFSFSGRIGRLRYLAYTWGLTLLIMMVMGILSAVLIPMFAGDGGGQGAVMALVFLMYVPMIVISFMMAVRRLNDINWSGWLSLLFLVPLVNAILGLLLLFMPGSKGPNDYGPQPAKDSALVIVCTLAIPVIFAVIGAMSLSAYQDFVERAQQQQMDPAEQQRLMEQGNMLLESYEQQQ